MGLWNSIEQLTRLNSWLQIAIIGFGILTGIFGAASYIVNNRKNSLESTKEENFKKNVKQLEERVSDIKSLPFRELTIEQKKYIINNLTGSNKINILFVRNKSKESQQYSLQFEEIFKSLGWKVEHYLPLSSSREILPAVIAVNENNKNLLEFSKLKDTFKRAGLLFKFDEFRGNFNHQIIFDVGVIPANDYQAVLDKID